MVFTSNWKAASSPSTQQQNNSNSTNNNVGSPFVMSPSAYAASQTANNNNSGGYNSSGGLSGGTNNRPFIGAQSTTTNMTGNNTNNMMGASQSATTNNNTNKADFNSLLANSSSLLSSIGRNNGANHQSTPNTGTQQNSTGTTASGVLGDKSLLELSVASRTGGAPSSFNTSTNPNNNNSMGSQQQQQQTFQQTSNYEKESAAHRLLARDGIGFDSVKLGKLTRELENRSSTNNTTGGNGYGGGGYYGSSYGADYGGGGGMDVEEEKKDDYDPTNNNTDTNYNPFDGHSKYVLSSLQGTSMKEILDNHHDYLCKSAVRQAREMAMKQSQKRMDEWKAKDWEEKKQEILGVGKVGNRFLLGGINNNTNNTNGSAVGTSGMGGGGEVNMIDNGVSSRVPLLEGDSTLGGGSAAVSSAAYSNIIPSPQTLSPNLEGIVKSHLSAIDKHLTSSSSTSSNNRNSGMALLTSLKDSLKQVPSAGITPESITGYSNALALIQSIVNCSTSLGIDLSNSTPRDGNAVAATVMGSCNFFAQQFTSHVQDVVRDAEMNGHSTTSTINNTLNSSKARDVCAFAALVAGRDVVDGNGGVWPRLFYSLRCGDMNAANSIIQQFGTVSTGGAAEDLTQVDPAVSDLVSQLAELQSSQETIFGDTTNGNTHPVQQLQSSLLNPTPTMMKSRRKVADLYERTKTRAQSSTGEQYMYYRAACLAMLGGSESISEASTLESSGLVKTVEDYLYASLWHAIHLADGNSMSLSGGSADGGSGLRKVSEAVARLSVLINQWGPSYFEQQDEDFTSASSAVALAAQGGTIGGANNLPTNKIPQSGGWAYALPLMASQQYATALAYLAEAGGGLGLLQAAHVGVVMNLMGLSIGDFTLDEHKSSQQTLLPMLVASYSASLQGVDAGAALKYLVLLSDKGKFVKEQAQRLILETRQFETLAGKIEPSGVRSNGALDAFFTKKEVSALLVDSANHAIRVNKPADAAELLVLSGRYGALFSLLNRELASYLNASTPEDVSKRQFWFNAASQFHAIHLAPGRVYVQNNLNEEGNLALGNTFQLLMNLIVFFDRCNEQQYKGAWVLMDDLQLIPKTEGEMTVKVEAFRGLDNCVRQVFHHVVLAAMEALCHLYRSLKQSGGGASVDQHNTIDQSLNELRTRARLLVTFARLLNLPSLGDSDTYVRINQLEKSMM